LPSTFVLSPTNSRCMQNKVIAESSGLKTEFYGLGLARNWSHWPLFLTWNFGDQHKLAPVNHVTLRSCVTDKLLESFVFHKCNEPSVHTNCSVRADLMNANLTAFLFLCRKCVHDVRLGVVLGLVLSSLVNTNGLTASNIRKEKNSQEVSIKI